MSLISQPKETTVSRLSHLLGTDTRSVDFAVAYATFSGVRLLFDNTSIRSLSSCKKRFLVGIDWFRSEPSAIDALQALTKGNVKVVDGDYLVNAKNCQPRRTFHPKAYSVNNARTTLLVGSANLSKNGLSKSIELSLSTSVSKTVAEYDQWFGEQWKDATAWSKIRSKYISDYGKAKKEKFVLTDDDDADPGALRLRWVTDERLRLMRAAQNLWVDVGNLHNRDPQGLPGTDLQFTQMTRVFFGYPAKIVPGNTPLLDIDLTMSGARLKNRPMVFNKSSSMDRLSLPVPGEDGWPAAYDGKTLLFTKAEDGSFLVKMASGTDRRRWRDQSEKHGFRVDMSNSTREWGVF